MFRMKIISSLALPWSIYSIAEIGLLWHQTFSPGCIVTFRSAPVYESKARMWLAGKLDISEGRLYTEELLDYLGTQAELLRSHVIQKRALARVGTKFRPFAAFAT